MSEKLISVNVETMDGEQVPVRVNLENKVEKLMREAAKELGIDADIRLYDLTYDGQRQDPDVKIEDTPIRDGSLVRLERRPRVG
ncbi:MAG: ubiquitin-like protein [Bacillota bacterium]